MASSKGSMIFLSFMIFGLGTFERASCSASKNATCIQRERGALLKFREALIDNSNLLLSWIGDECCSWKGVRCNKQTGHVLKLDLRSPCVVWEPIYYRPFNKPMYGKCALTGLVHSSLTELQHLNYLDLSWNNFSYSKLPEFISSLSNLEYLNLSNTCFIGKVPLHLGNLSNLQYLDLNNYYSDYVLTLENLEWVSGTPSLKHVDLSGISIRNAEGWLQSMSMLSSLQFLGLAECNLPKVNQPLVVNFTSLRHLNLSGNSFGSVIPKWLLNLSSITHLSLSSNFDGANLSFPTEIVNNNIQLAYLDLEFNSMRGELPKNLSNLCHLFVLRLARNSFIGDISTILGNSFNCSQNKLSTLDLAFNNINGRLGDQIAHFNNLDFISLSGNSIEGPIPESLPRLSSLKFLNLWSNKLTGGIPESIWQMSNLVLLDLSNNHLKGVVSEHHLTNLTSLKRLDISSNEFPVDINPIAAFQPKVIGMSNYKVGPQFPTWLREQRNLTRLYLSNANISGVVPHWFYNISSQIRYLDLSSNQLTGQTSACKMKHLVFLDLSNNQLSGVLPDCWESLSELYALNLGNNQLRGQIPKSMCSLQLSYLDLHGNGFDGSIPDCLSTMIFLEELDLSRNKFAGRIPSWIGHMVQLNVLNLESNSFHGEIHTSICQLSHLRLLNLAHNNLFGSIPLCFDSLTAMLDPNSGTFTYWFGVEVHMKSITQVYTSALRYLFSLDLSNNKLSGQIPTGLTKLLRLQNLNLSNNNLWGGIPSELADLKNLESLDLSINQLSGPIPQSITKLDSLGYLNLSCNRLSGPIPWSAHMTTFRMESYLENDGLCGPPLSKNCSVDHDRPDDIQKQHSDDSDGEDESYTRWLFASFVSGYATGLSVVCGSLYFKQSWRHSFFRWSDKILTELHEMVEININRLRNAS